jgi:hypothetical protein
VSEHRSDEGASSAANPSDERWREEPLGQSEHRSDEGASSAANPSDEPPPWQVPPPASLWTAHPVPASSWVTRKDLRVALVVIGILVVLGAIVALYWGRHSPHSVGVVETKSIVIPDETESFISADGQFAVITAVIGLLAGITAWFWRPTRGPVMVAALAVGGALGAIVMALVGHLVSSGHAIGAVNTLITLPITLHAHGLLAVEPFLAVAAYMVGVLLIAPDDLGRAEQARPEPVVEDSSWVAS